MIKFQFSNSNESSNESPEIATFKGDVFYQVYKKSEFLRNNTNVEMILSKGYEIRHQLKNVNPGSFMVIEGMTIKQQSPLLIKKTGPNVKVEDYEFTYNRLTGLVAAYAFANRIKFPDIISSEAQALGLVWDNCDQTMCRLYLSAVSGTGHFINQFSYWPLLCALRKFQLNKITLEPVVKMAKIKNNGKVTMSRLLVKNYSEALKLWSHFPNSKVNDLKNIFTSSTTPKQLKSMFFESLQL